MRQVFERIDARIIIFMREISVPASRIALFVVFFWFGTLKVFAYSPANPLVAALLASILPLVIFSQFIVFFGAYEMAVGIAFLIPGLERFAIALLVPHMITTFLPLVLLPQMTWQSFLAPTLEGQYIIKNLLILALAVGVAAHLHIINEPKTSS